MSRIANTFERLRAEKRTALIPYITAGDPTLAVTEAVVPALVAGGADLIELGIPYSDPLADGPTIQLAAQRALDGGATIAKVHESVKRLRDQGVDVPLLYLVYYNCIFRQGEERFVADAAAAGVDGLIVPDLPLEAGESLRQLTTAAGLDLIYLLAPTSTPERIKRTAERASGFIYCVSLTGVTGARTEISAALEPFLDRVRKSTDVPLAVGFGISTPDQAAQVASVADGVIVGSALINSIHDNASSPEAAAEAAHSFMASFRQGIDRGTLTTVATND